MVSGSLAVDSVFRFAMMVQSQPQDPVIKEFGCMTSICAMLSPLHVL
jgi:hypothetical protein